MKDEESRLIAVFCFVASFAVFFLLATVIGIISVRNGTMAAADEESAWFSAWKVGASCLFGVAYPALMWWTNGGLE